MKAGVKKHTHLVILLLTALNACAGWHDTAPFVAWPATNHLRWVDNVGVYTNESVWTNSGYGAWTNNYVSTNVHLYVDPYGKYDYSQGTWVPSYVYWPFPIADASSLTNVMLNAKDVRSLDCISAVCERYLACDATHTVSNFWEEAVPVDDNWIDNPRYEIWRDEQRILASLKKYIHNDIGYGEAGALQYFYYPIPTNSTPTNWVAFTEATLCARSGVVSNFFRYTPHRAADGSWTHYQRILTNTFVLCQGTNATHVATNNLVDSAGIEFTAVGTNGLTVTRYATNTSIQAGATLADYGWDAFRRVISTLNTTVKTVTWGIGSGTNWSKIYGANYGASSTMPVNFTAGTYQAQVDWPVVKDAATAANIFLPYSTDNIQADTWGFDFSDTLASPSTFTKTNTAPYFNATAMAGKDQDFWAQHEAGVFANPTTYAWELDENPPVWRLVFDRRSWYRTNNTDWINYGAPLVHVAGNTNLNRSVLHYAKTNGATVLVTSNYYPAGTSSATSTIFRITQPVLTNFWFSYFSRFDMGTPDNWWNGYWFWQANLHAPVTLKSSVTTFHTNYLGTVTAGVTISTNFTAPTVTADKAVEIWDFEYK
jgi:hypothetical protein